MNGLKTIHKRKDSNMPKSIDITGQKFGKLTAIKFSHIQNKKHFWLFKCDCGNLKTCSKATVTRGESKSCGCGDNPVKCGDKFNKLTAMNFKRFDNKHIQYWNFLCECGNEKELPISRVKHGSIKSCGCLKTKHKKTCSQIHDTWIGIKQRCHNEKSAQYKYYGAKGIFVCDEWHKFENFYRDMGEPPTKLHTIDRIDPKKGYSKDNTRWATRSQQSRNIPKISIKTSSIYKGVSWEKRRNHWVVWIYRELSTPKYIGSFKTELEAAKAYNEAAKKYFGEFAQLNDV